MIFKMKDIYYCKVTWFNSDEEKNVTDTALVLANSYSQAISKIEKSFFDIEEIFAEKIGYDVNCIFIDSSDSTREMIKNYNAY